MENVNKFLNLFSDFELVIQSRTKDNQKHTKQIKSSYKSKSDLKKAFKRLSREYKQAQKSFKANKITKQELFDFEWRIFEIQEEIKKLEEQDYNNRFEKDQDI